MSIILMHCYVNVLNLINLSYTMKCIYVINWIKYNFGYIIFKAKVSEDFIHIIKYVFDIHIY